MKDFRPYWKQSLHCFYFLGHSFHLKGFNKEVCYGNILMFVLKLDNWEGYDIFNTTRKEEQFHKSLEGFVTNPESYQKRN